MNIYKFLGIINLGFGISFMQQMINQHDTFGIFINLMCIIVGAALISKKDN